MSDIRSKTCNFPTEYQTKFLQKRLDVAGIDYKVAKAEDGFFEFSIPFRQDSEGRREYIDHAILDSIFYEQVHDVESIVENKSAKKIIKVYKEYCSALEIKKARDGYVEIRGKIDESSLFSFNEVIERIYKENTPTITGELSRSMH